VRADVVAPDGKRWKVVRRVLPWRPRWRGEDPLSWDISFETAFLLALAIPVLLLELVLAPLLVLPKFLLRRPWRIEATTDGPPVERITWKARGWSASGARVVEIATALGAAGAVPGPPPSDHRVAGARPAEGGGGISLG
jgi:hypothetical protein